MAKQADDLTTKQATVWGNERAIVIVTDSGFGAAYITDHEAFFALLTPKSSNSEIGDAVKKALAASKVLDSSGTWINDPARAKKHEEFLERFVSHYGFASQRSFFRRAFTCELELEGDSVVIQPLQQISGDKWDGFKDQAKRNVRASIDASDAELGKAVRLAITRCETTAR
jgi:hypothetical protein